MIEFYYAGLTYLILAVILDALSLIIRSRLTRFILLFFSVILLFASLPQFAAAAERAAALGRAEFNAVVFGGIYIAYVLIAVNIVFAIYLIFTLPFE